MITGRPVIILRLGAELCASEISRHMPGLLCRSGGCRPKNGQSLPVVPGSLPETPARWGQAVRGLNIALA